MKMNHDEIVRAMDESGYDFTTLDGQDCAEIVERLSGRDLLITVYDFWASIPEDELEELLAEIERGR